MYMTLTPQSFNTLNNPQCTDSCDTAPLSDVSTQATKLLEQYLLVSRLLPWLTNHLAAQLWKAMTRLNKTLFDGRSSDSNRSLNDRQ
jgi:hypothetical protein